ncbi:molybdopterin binding domain protein [Methylocella silvestris BL2]|uniref:Molybdopterin binding domain protein n=1 Tax=Methylocella silvestris (strain DSM 15510 / CIP 108128 / LMG 27833 / NCIMB 13906 / BL2) TaxID=395965 RepID=B8ERK4_METSB|nr:molybdopterin-binding protein [Methylocella silvestris]ACK51056.1 molybdopterin binding domain protein [Methylocella silvestris BL2]
MAQKADITAAVLVIGDEILSGRTKDANSGYIADYLAAIGVDLREVRVIGDVEPEIVAAVNALRARYDYVFTTGGIGPTHDDITADAIARAFGVGISEDPRAIALLLEKIKPEDLNEARRRMARVPHGAELVENDISKAPGFWIGNVIVMAGVPAIMKAMLDRVGPKLCKGLKVVARAILADNIPEGAYAAGLSDVARANPALSIGSYPSFRDGGFRNEIVVRGKDADQVGAAAVAIEALLASLREGEAGRQRAQMKSRQ